MRRDDLGLDLDRGGLSLWVRLPLHDTDPSVEHASSHIRLSFDRPKPMLCEGIERLAAAWATYTTARPASTARHSPPVG